MPDQFDISKLPDDAKAYVEELQKKLEAEPSEEQVAAIQKAVDDAVEKAKADWTAEIEEIAKNESGEESTLDPELRKALDGVSADVRKALEGEIAKANEAAAQAVAKADEERDARLRSEHVVKAKADFANLDDPEKIAGTIWDLRKAGQTEQADQLETTMKAASAQLESQEMFKELGSSLTPDAGSPEGKLEAMAKSISEKEGIDFHSAYDKATRTPEGASLYDQLIQEG